MIIIVVVFNCSVGIIFPRLKQKNQMIHSYCYQVFLAA